MRHSTDLEGRLSGLLGAHVVRLSRIQSRGYGTAFHAIAEVDDGRTVFVKVGMEDVTSAFLREEINVYRAVHAPFMPVFHGADERDPPILVLEDLSGGRWPPPWDGTAIEAVRDTLAAVAQTRVPEELGSIEDDRERLCGGWAEIERDPQSFLSLGVCTPDWLGAALPALREAAEAAPIEGESLIHLDVRSDNICLTERGAVLVDWNHACRANPDLDLAFWLPSLRLEGGPPPEALLSGGGAFAALLAGFFGSRAGLPPPETAPDVRAVQLAQLRVALPWAARELGLAL
jgi:thiamine kinase-like enzyme